MSKRISKRTRDRAIWILDCLAGTRALDPKFTIDMLAPGRTNATPAEKLVRLAFYDLPYHWRIPFEVFYAGAAALLRDGWMPDEPVEDRHAWLKTMLS